MKISTTNLLHAIWLYQIKEASTGVLHRYVGGNHGLCSNNDFWRKSATSIHRCERQHITSKISKAQLLRRIKALIDEGLVEWTSFYLVFSVKSDSLTTELFIDARNFWLNQGVPEGVKNGRSNTVKIENLEQKQEAALSYLMEKHFYDVLSFDWSEAA
jgi:hypothetical protein